MKRILILTNSDFINPEKAEQSIFLATPKQPFSEIDYDVIIYEGKTVKNRFGEGEIDLSKLF